MAGKAYHLKQSTMDPNSYFVDKLVNSLEPTVGSVLKRGEVDELITNAIRKGDKVHIARAELR